MGKGGPAGRLVVKTERLSRPRTECQRRHRPPLRREGRVGRRTARPPDFVRWAVLSSCSAKNSPREPVMTTFDTQYGMAPVDYTTRELPSRLLGE